MKHAAKDIAEGRTATPLIFFLIGAFFATSIILSSLFIVGQNLVRIGDIVELLLRLIVTLVLIRMVLQRQLPVRLFDFSVTSILLQSQNLVHVSILVSMD